MTIHNHMSSTSLHQRILGDIEGRILSGALPPGARIATEQELAATYGCSRMTVSKVLVMLANAGLVERRRKAGTFVRQPSSQAAILEIHDIKAEVLALGQAYRFEMMRRTMRRGDRDDHDFLGEHGGGRLLEVTGRHFAGRRVFCLEERLINLKAVPQAEAQSFADVSPGRWLLDTVPWTEAEHRIHAAGASRAEARSLAVRTGAPCLVVERRTWRGKTPITLVRLLYPGDAHRLVAHFRPLRK
ncbi:MAG: histidine utilization repressor [Alphaproteobacteria bacterium]|nr:histidine utilization repressor [Alphaproteobacteria bacterium]MCW5741523.1 histidine utilization repressor [Alphaproteobacteria bacterium]